MNFNTTIRTLTKSYTKLSNIGKVLLFLILLLILMMFFKKLNPFKEGFQQTDKFIFKTNDDLYDDFYANIYDYLVYNSIKNDYEVGSIINSAEPNDTSLILDVGSGTGHHVALIANKGYNVIGLDKSQAMVNKAKEKYPQYNFELGDALNPTQFNMNSFTHILCLYFTIYYFKDKRLFFDNCMDWLMPGGYLIIHIVDREKFDPILPPGNPLYIVSPQKYAKERITKTKVTFNDFTYNSDFKLDSQNNKAVFDEKFRFDNGTTRKQEQVLYMEDADTILAIAQECGFIIKGKIDLVKCAYEHQYLYILVKP